MVYAKSQCMFQEICRGYLCSVLLQFGITNVPVLEKQPDDWVKVLYDCRIGDNEHMPTISLRRVFESLKYVLKYHGIHCLRIDEILLCRK